MIPDSIVVHHSLTKDSATVSWGAIRRYHLSLGWRDIGYHYGVELVGDYYEILSGRMPMDRGAHTSQDGMNTRSLGVVVVGNFDLAPPPAAALDRLVILVRSLQETWRIPVARIYRHSEFASYKSCPGTLFPWDSFRTRLQE